MSQIAQSYFHLAVQVDESAHSELADIIRNQYIRYLGAELADALELDLNLKNGSLKIWLSANGNLSNFFDRTKQLRSTTFKTVSGVGAFGSGIVIIYQLASFSWGILSGAHNSLLFDLQQQGVPNNAIVRTEHRRRSVGTIAELGTTAERFQFIPESSSDDFKSAMKLAHDRKFLQLWKRLEKYLSDVDREFLLELLSENERTLIEMNKSSLENDSRFVNYQSFESVNFDLRNTVNERIPNTLGAPMLLSDNQTSISFDYHGIPLNLVDKSE